MISSSVVPPGEKQTDARRGLVYLWARIDWSRATAWGSRRNSPSLVYTSPPPPRDRSVRFSLVGGGATCIGSRGMMPLEIASVVADPNDIIIIRCSELPSIHQSKAQRRQSIDQLRITTTQRFESRSHTVSNTTVATTTATTDRTISNTTKLC